MTLVKHQEDAAGRLSVLTDNLVDLSRKGFKFRRSTRRPVCPLEALTFICPTNGETENLLGF